MNPNVLIVEDIKHTLAALELLVKHIQKDEMKRHGIDDFIIHKSRSVSEAMATLEQAGREKVYDIIILDLGLPISEPNEEPYAEDPENGLRVIDHILQSGCGSQVIVHSVHTHYKYVAQAFRRGAVDFVAKDQEDSILEQAVLAAWDRLLAQKTRMSLESRFRKLVPFAQTVLTHQLSGCFSRLVQSVAHETEAMAEDLKIRLGVDKERDKNDPLVERLGFIAESLESSKREWFELQKNHLEREIPRIIIIEDELSAIEEHQLPCLTLKGASTKIPKEGATRALCFSDDVPTILEELIVGALIEEPDRSGVSKDDYVEPSITISVTPQDGTAQVRFVDNLKPIAHDVADAINRGFSIKANHNFGRAWGLSVAQHAALRGGGRLTIEPQKNGNWISYWIPLTT